MTAQELAIHISRDEFGFFCYLTTSGSILHSRDQMTVAELEEHCKLYASNVPDSDDYEDTGADVNDAYPLGLPSFNWAI